MTLPATGSRWATFTRDTTLPASKEPLAGSGSASGCAQLCAAQYAPCLSPGGVYPGAAGFFSYRRYDDTCWCKTSDAGRAADARLTSGRACSVRPISSHWRFGLNRTAALDESLRQRIRDEAEPGARRLTLQPAVERGALLLVPRHPRFRSKAIARQAGLPARPGGSVLVQPPATPQLVPGGHGGKANCLTTRDPALRMRRWAEFSLEVVVLFLPNPASDRGMRSVYQTIVGRNGAGFREGVDGKLSSLYLKVSPTRQVLFEAWATDGRYHKLASQHLLSANVWYTITASSRALPNGGGYLWSLHANGLSGGSMIVRSGGLAVPPRHSDGDFTFGCGMYAGVAADPCWCLINEARITDRSRREDEQLYYRDVKA